MTPFDPRLPIIAADARVKTCHVFHCWCAMKEMGASFHVQAFAHFAGLTADHVTAIVAAMEAHEAMPGGRAKVLRRATRLPDDFTMPPDWITWATDLRHWEPADAQTEGEIFASYWQSKAGQAATKVDWFKTWQNWVRNSRRANGTYNLDSAIGAGAFQGFIDRLEQRARQFEIEGKTGEAAAIRKQLAEIRPAKVVSLVDQKAG